MGMNWAIQTSFVGDAILTLPFLHRLLETQDNVLLVAAPRNKAIFDLAMSRGLSQFKSHLQIVSWDKKSTRNPFTLHKLAREWRERFSPQRTYCIQRSFSTALLAQFSQARESIGFASGAASFFYTDCVAREWDSGRHEIEKNLDLLRLNYNVNSWDENSPSLLAPSVNYTAPKKTKDPIVALSLASPWATKEWELHEASDLIARLVGEGVEVYLLGDKSFNDRADFLEKKIQSRLLKNFSGKTSLSEWVDLIAQSNVLVSGDSAAVHVASDLGVPVIALFGPTIAEFGFAPWRKNSRVLSLDMECRPCDIHGPKVCPLGHHNCLKNIKSDWVHSFVQESL